MTEPDSSLTPNVPATTSDSSTTTSATTEQPSTAPSRTGGLWFVLLLTLIITLCSSAAAAWYYWTKLRLDNDVQQQTSALVSQQAQTIEALQSKLVTQQSAIQDLNSQQQSTATQVDETLAAASDNIEVLQQQIALLESQLAEIGGRRPSDWLLAEADYLVRMAGRKLWLENDYTSAMMMLKAADSRLNDLADPSLLPVRQLLAEDIQTLQQVNPTSLTSVALSISGMIGLVEELPLDTLKLPEPAAGEETQTVTDSVSDWQDNLRRSWDSLVDEFVDFKRRDAAIEPYMSEKLQWLIKEQLSFVLLQAKTAALQAEPTLYQQSLQRALEIVVDDFELDSIPVQQFMAALQNLIETPVDKTFPQQFKSQQPLQDRLDSRINALFNNRDQAL